MNQYFFYFILSSLFFVLGILFESRRVGVSPNVEARRRCLKRTEDNCLAYWRSIYLPVEKAFGKWRKYKKNCKNDLE